MKYATIIAITFVLSACGLMDKESVVVSAESETATAEEAAVEAVPEKVVYTQTSLVKAYETAYCTRTFECFPNDVVTRVLNVKDVEECVQNEIADGYSRRDGEGKPLFCNAGGMFQEEQAGMCIDWLMTMHCGEFVQIFLTDDGSFKLCGFACTTGD